MIQHRSCWGFTERNVKKEESIPPNCFVRKWIKQWKVMSHIWKRYFLSHIAYVLGLSWSGWNPSNLLNLPRTRGLQTPWKHHPLQSENLWLGFKIYLRLHADSKNSEGIRLINKSNISSWMWLFGWSPTSSLQGPNS